MDAWIKSGIKKKFFAILLLGHFPFSARAPLKDEAEKHETRLKIASVITRIYKTVSSLGQD
jgi:hypothetical protein